MPSLHKPSHKDIGFGDYSQKQSYNAQKSAATTRLNRRPPAPVLARPVREIPR
jgi:hypothetical protein